MEEKRTVVIGRVKEPPIKEEPKRQIGGPQSGLPPPYIVGQGVAPHLIVGIDFGTANCRVSTFANGAPCHLRPHEFRAILEEILGVSSSEPRLVYSLKHCLAGAHSVKVGDVVHSSVDVASKFLQYVKDSVQRNTERLLSKAVISVPACFTHRQRQDVLQAAANVDIDVLGLINDPTAAALEACYMQNLQNGRYIVLSSGVYSFEVTVVHVQNRLIETKAIRGAKNLSGHAITEALVNGVRAQLDTVDAERLHIAVDRAKEDLDNAGVASIDVDGRRFTFDRAKAAQWLEDQKTMMEALIERVLADGLVNDTDIVGVVLAGAATKLWIIDEILKSRFPRASCFHADIANGAAIHAALLARQTTEWVVWDAMAAPVLVAEGTHLRQVIAANSPLPISGHVVLAPGEDGKARTQIVQLMVDGADEVEPVANVNIVDELQYAAAGASVDLSVHASADGVLTFSARHKILDVHLTVEVTAPLREKSVTIDLTHEQSATPIVTELCETGISVEHVSGQWFVVSVQEILSAAGIEVKVYDELLSIDGANVQQLGEKVPDELRGPRGSSKTLILRSAAHVYSVTLKCLIPVDRWTVTGLKIVIANATISGEDRVLAQALLDYGRYCRSTAESRPYSEALEPIKRAIAICTQSVNDPVLHLRALCELCGVWIDLTLHYENDPQRGLEEIDKLLARIIDLVGQPERMPSGAARLLYDLSGELSALHRICDPSAKIATLIELALSIASSNKMQQAVLDQISDRLKLPAPDVHLTASIDDEPSG